VPRVSPYLEGNTAERDKRRVRSRLRAVRDPKHVRKHIGREPGEPVVAREHGPCREVRRRTPTMNDDGQSDSWVVPAKSANKAAPEAAAEQMEGRRLVKGNADESPMSRA
jgi:hypothetical protein